MAKAPETSPSAELAVPIPAIEIAPFGKRPLRTFALFIGLPAFLLYVVSAGLVIMALAGMASEMDRTADQRGITSMHAALDSFLNDLAGTVSDNGTWDEAYLNVVVTPDPAWMDATWGATARLGQTYDNVLVTDQSGAIVFGENGAGPLKGNIVSRYPAAATMLRKLDQGIAATTDATTVSLFSADPDGTVGLAAISIHQTAPAQAAVPRQTRRVLWIAKHMTATLLQDIAVRYQTPLAVLTKDPDPDASSIGLVDADNHIVGTVAWFPDRPGDSALNHMVLIATVIFFAIGMLLVVGLGALRRAMLRRVRAITESHQAAIETVIAAVAPKPAPAAKRDEASGEDVAGEDADPNSALAGVSAGDFVIEYQPIFDLRSESLIGVEALLRWNKPDRSQLPQETLSPADRAKLFDRVGPIAIRHAAGEIAPLLGVTMNIAATPTQLLTEVYAEKVVGTLGATNFPARRLQLSVSTSLLPPLEQLRPALARLRQSGVAITLDDFVLNDTSVAYLDARLADRVRLSTALTSDDAQGPARQSFLAAAIEAARASGLPVTIPGLERKEQAARLLKLGCREFQGSLLAAPMPIGALTQLILAPAKPRKAG